MILYKRILSFKNLLCLYFNIIYIFYFMSLLTLGVDNMNTKIDVSKIRIETNRLILRGFTEGDLDDLYEYASVFGVGEMAGWHTHENKDESKKVLDTFIADGYTFAIVLKENQKVIGQLGLEESWINRSIKYNKIKTKEINYSLSRDYWGQGIMTEAVQNVIDFCFTELDLDALSCSHFSTNERSKRVIEKCGFTFIAEANCFVEGLLKNLICKCYVLTNKEKYDLVIYANEEEKE